MHLINSTVLFGGRRVNLPDAHTPLAEVGDLKVPHVACITPNVVIGHKIILSPI